jgi:hypothetical protein
VSTTSNLQANSAQLERRLRRRGAWELDDFVRSEPDEPGYVAPAPVGGRPGTRVFGRMTDNLEDYAATIAEWEERNRRMTEKKSEWLFVLFCFVRSNTFHSTA